MIFEFPSHFFFKSKIFLVIWIIPNGELEFLSTAVLVIHVEVDKLEKVSVDLNDNLHSNRFELKAIVLRVIEVSEVKPWCQELLLIEIW